MEMIEQRALDAREMAGLPPRAMFDQLVDADFEWRLERRRSC
jgi:hypothetical protein